MVGNNILVTGGAGYIGSHTVLELLLGGYNTVVIDNLDKDLAGYNGQYLTFHQVDLLDKPALEKVFSESKFDAVIHFAGQKAGECVAENLIRTITLLVVMAAHGCKKLVVSTSATPKEVPCTEESPLSEMSHYGPIQVFTEDICRDFLRGDPEWRIIMLRYFNPVGAQPSGRFGEDPYHILIMSYLEQVADYATKVGASVRDYLQVVDLADGHICALQKLDDTEIGCEVYNLGPRTTVLEMVGASEKASGMENPLVKGPGDPIEVDGVSEKSVVSGIQCTDLPIEVSEKSEGTASASSLSSSASLFSSASASVSSLSSSASVSSLSSSASVSSLSSSASVSSEIVFTKENIIERIDVVLKFLKIFSDLRSKQILVVVVDDVKRQDLLIRELKAFLTAAKIAKDIKGEVENGGEDGFGSQIAGVKSLTKSMEKRYQDVISRTEWECKREWL